MKPLILLGLVVLTLSACARVQNVANNLVPGQSGASRSKVEINDRRFRARATADRNDSRNFSVSVTPVSVDPEAALEAGRYQATRYCLLTFGGSDTEWRIGPDTPLEGLGVQNDTVVLEGRCTQR